MTEWQPIATAPKDGTSIMIYAYGSHSIASWNGRGHWNLEVNSHTLAYGCGGEIQVISASDVKVWMPLPQPPGDA